MNIEFTDDPHPRNTFWEMWGLPMFDIKDASAVMMELAECRKIYGDRYIRLSAFDSSHGWESVKISFIVEPAEGGARLRSSAPGGERAEYPLHHTALRREPACGAAL